MSHQCLLFWRMVAVYTPLFVTFIAYTFILLTYSFVSRVRLTLQSYLLPLLFGLRTFERDVHLALLG